jgi:S-adenosylmethionine:tRNA ribosyltransferase-isomerase
VPLEEARIIAESHTGFNPMDLSDFDYTLPQELIAQQPLSKRSASRLLHVLGPRLADRRVADLPGVLRPGDLLVFNDSRVIHARLFAIKQTGGKVELLIERPVGPNEALALVRASHPPQPGSRLRVAEAFDVEVVGREGEFYRLRFPDTDPMLDLIEWHGALPLPPYIERAAGAADETRYQTVYARVPGSVAAPTAGLHFDADLLAALDRAGIGKAHVTLHVGAGTFQPVRTTDVARHRMHSERFEIPAATAAAIEATRARGGRVVAVGTTSLRTLEAAALAGDLRAGTGETDLFVLPGFRFRVVDCLFTNFHLPRSTLLMLVSAFAGIETIRGAYRHAVQARYRFFSYGDAMLLERDADAL